MSPSTPSRFVWFWTFWHWSRESHREGLLLRSPLNGIGGHWDEWFRNQATEYDRRAIQEAGQTETSQRQFIGWLLKHWSREAFADGNRSISRFALGELGQFPPFNDWPSFARYRAGYNVVGISAVVLAEGSAGEPEDVRAIEAIALPADATARPVVADGFQIDQPEFTRSRLAAMSMLGGKGLFCFLALWVMGGRRPYPRWWQVLLSLGWVVVGGSIIYLLVGPDPGDSLGWISVTLFSLWSALLLHAVSVVGVHGLAAWRGARGLRSVLVQSQVRLRMKGGLTLQGGSAGLAFCLNILQSVYRNHRPARRNSWIWRRLFGQLESASRLWAATGAITGDGWLKPVILGPKIRACLQHAEIRYIFSPYQCEGKQRTVDRMTPVAPRAVPPGASSAVGIPRLGFAAETHLLASRRGFHLAQALQTIGGFSSKWQTTMNGLAVFISTIMVIALPDLLGIINPPLAPTVVAPGSPSAYYLWVSLNTRQAGYFRVVLESGFWANRRADVKNYSGANASVRAEVSLHRLDVQTAYDDEDGVVWIERRYRFLNREFALDDRVGRYTLSYLTRIDHE